MQTFEHDTVVPVESSVLSKKEQVAQMFDNISFRYDFLNRFLSIGIDVWWRKNALKELIAKKPSEILDVATGTGDIAIMAKKMLHPNKIVGIDISDGMLELGRKKILAKNLSECISLQHGDSETINYPANSFDAVTVAFGVRNFQHLEQGLSEILRVLKPGGKLVVLEFSKPKTIVIKQLYNIYMNYITPTICSLFSKNRSAYKYLNESIKKFPEGNNFTQILDNLGYRNTYCKPQSVGICSIYCGEK